MPCCHLGTSSLLCVILCTTIIISVSLAVVIVPFVGLVFVSLEGPLRTACIVLITVRATAAPQQTAFAPLAATLPVVVVVRHQIIIALPPVVTVAVIVVGVVVSGIVVRFIRLPPLSPVLPADLGLMGGFGIRDKFVSLDGLASLGRFASLGCLLARLRCLLVPRRRRRLGVLFRLLSLGRAVVVGAAALLPAFLSAVVRSVNVTVVILLVRPVSALERPTPLPRLLRQVQPPVEGRRRGRSCRELVPFYVIGERILVSNVVIVFVIVAI
mmetsp:Transcript_6656/g.11781  ORF Transcript_6656/g.11781 Transcript_6656/m.11781 type:complete len:270 (-) Transcript_6656:463-1272(-)